MAVWNIFMHVGSRFVHAIWVVFCYINDTGLHNCWQVHSFDKATNMGEDYRQLGNIDTTLHHCMVD